MSGIAVAAVQDVEGARPEIPLVNLVVRRPYPSPVTHHTAVAAVAAAMLRAVTVLRRRRDPRRRSCPS
ncbi:hypothetical protein GS473_08205 [Rhodococcus hoagii]|nr:hypothetical protein [Prescottella equi]